MDRPGLPAWVRPALMASAQLGQAPAARNRRSRGLWAGDLSDRVAQSGTYALGERFALGTIATRGIGREVFD